MHQFRITKYDPAVRNKSGHYTREEWTAFSDVGRTVGGVVLTLAEYERVEAAYIDAALGFLREAGICTLSIRGLENSFDSPSAPTEGAELELSALAEAMRGVLREEFWCRFEGRSAFVHFGWDYYMYVGVASLCESAQRAASEQGLFVEPFASPYRDGPEPN